jgi:putative flippase GtrA
MKKKRSLFWQLSIKLIKYGMVGCSGIVIDFSVTYTLIEFTTSNIFVSNALGFVLAALSNYYINSKWTFKNNQTEKVSGFLRFFFFSAIGLVLNYFILNLFMRYAEIDFYASKSCAIAVVFVWNFSANYLFTFKEKKRSGSNSSVQNLDSISITDVLNQ